MNSSIKSQDWLDTTLYPFEHHFIQLETGKMHYVDQGSGEVILFIHGTPTWSFLYRDFITSLSTKYRCIAPDHIGFGLSEKPENFESTPQAHSKNLDEFIHKLNLKNMTLVVHDFGGPIGLSAAIQNNDRIKRVVLLNTWLWETQTNPAAQKVNNILQSGLGKFLYLRLNFSPKVLLKKGFYDQGNLSKEVHQQYISPFPNKSSRWSLLRIGQSLIGASDWYQQQWEQLHVLEDKPWLIIWGMQDSFITPEYLKKWTHRLPKARVVLFECGHFVQEEATSQSIHEIENFMNP
ncbi:alpha/beta fold hydrolase [bacterium SCSIO 12643]|nr:alpha/beta fold hydrolase [bacterium SCSIO 12643]